MTTWWSRFLDRPVLGHSHPRPTPTPVKVLNSFFGHVDGWSAFHDWCGANKILLHLDQKSTSSPFLFVDLPESPIFVFDLTDRDLQGRDVTLTESLLKIMECAAMVRPKAECDYDYLHPDDFTIGGRSHSRSKSKSRSRSASTHSTNIVMQKPQTVHGVTFSDSEEEEKEEKTTVPIPPRHSSSSKPPLPPQDAAAENAFADSFYLRLRLILLNPGEEVIAMDKTSTPAYPIYISSHGNQIFQGFLTSGRPNRMVSTFMVEKLCFQLGIAPRLQLFRRTPFHYACKRNIKYHSFTLLNYLQQKNPTQKQILGLIKTIALHIVELQKNKLSHGNLSLTNILFVPETEVILFSDFRQARLTNWGKMEYIMFAQNFDKNIGMVPKQYWVLFQTWFELITRLPYGKIVQTTIERPEASIATSWGNVFKEDQDFFLRSFLKRTFSYEPPSRERFHFLFQLTGWSRNLVDNPWVFSQSNDVILKIAKNLLQVKKHNLSTCDELRYEILMHQEFYKKSSPTFRMAPKLYNWNRYLIDKKWEVVVCQTEKITTLLELLSQPRSMEEMNKFFLSIADYFIEMCKNGLWHMDAHIANWGWINTTENALLFDYAHASLHSSTAKCEWSYDFMELPRSLRSYYTKRTTLKDIHEDNWSLIVPALRKCLERLTHIKHRTWLPAIPPMDITDPLAFFNAIFDQKKGQDLLDGIRLQWDEKRLHYVEGHWKGDKIS